MSFKSSLGIQSGSQLKRNCEAALSSYAILNFCVYNLKTKIVLITYFEDQLLQLCVLCSQTLTSMFQVTKQQYIFIHILRKSKHLYLYAMNISLQTLHMKYFYMQCPTIYISSSQKIVKIYKNKCCYNYNSYNLLNCAIHQDE